LTGSNRRFKLWFEMATTPVAAPPSFSIASSAPTRERLVEVAERRFAEHGFTDTSVRDITAGAGCNLASVNYHFGGKEQLYQEVFRRRLGQMREERLASLREIRSEAEEGAGLETLLRAFVLAFLSPFTAPDEGQRWVQLMWRELSEPHLPRGLFTAEIITPVYEELAEVLLRACPGLDPVRARRSAHSLIAQLNHFMRFERFFVDSTGRYEDSITEPGLIDHVVRFSAAGIRAAAAEGGGG
jgi:AcrR family transcriptional regulator